MSPSERIKHIKAIASALSSEEWSLLDLTLKQFGLPWTDQWGGTKEAYVIEMVAHAEDEQGEQRDTHFVYAILAAQKTGH